ncbi:copper fist DNA binding domain-containing protein [Lentinula aciculospora]|uniref:Copper fist DNA binding domain-containing protein n=1 Tax=Lentinula aciculospora TaxID=153920 RepID=A0A9W9APU9_9AGAR|nr:copper fist DNA binding domain-containing protein [Lentinula aciculospora]
MVLIESKKYACETCIKGHRSSACKHTDRPLYEIKKKGRPVTQCEHCRELRKTKQVHVKCICHKEDTVAGGEQTSDCSKQGVNKMLESAAFPDGLPKALEASVAVQLLSQGATSDSDLDGCSCLSGDECHCWTPRKAAPRVKKKGKSISDLATSTSSPSEIPITAKAQSTSSVSTRLADLRALLPKPAHDPSSSAVDHPGGRHHPHELYSPYGRAHDQIHSNHPIRHTSKSPQTDNTPSAFPIGLAPDVQRSYYHLGSAAYLPHVLTSADSTRSSQVIYPEFDAAGIEAWNTFQMTGAANIAGSLCGCGDECACPSCTIHKPNTNPTSFDTSQCGFASQYRSVNIRQHNEQFD